MTDPDALVDLIRDSVIGDDEAVAGPFGIRRVTYADYTASGRALSFIEDYLRDAVLPLYANTHTESSGTGLQTSRFREEARRIIRDAVGGSDDHAVIFCGSGMTAAINKLVDVLNLRIPNDLDDRYALRSHIPPDERPLVFIGPYEHHSNELPWRESIADVVTIGEDADGRIDLARARARARGDRGPAASDRLVLGGVERHRHPLRHPRHLRPAPPPRRALVLGLRGRRAVRRHRDDAAPARARRRARLQGRHRRSARTSSSAGPARRASSWPAASCSATACPTAPGGGTVAYVNPLEHVYLADPEHREEGGTPAIVESIRAGLAFQLKERVGSETIRTLEEAFIGRAMAGWADEPGIGILGNPALPRLSIVSFTIRHDGRYLHHNFVVALLNDLFGIQSRGGCSCAGPYGHRLLGIDIETSHAFEREISRGCEGSSPAGSA